MIQRHCLPAACREVRQQTEPRPSDEAHLNECVDCRESLASERAVSNLLGRVGSAAGAPRDLSARLAAIAGDQAHQPLWLAPSGTGTLPSPRRARRRRAVTGSVTMLACMGMLFTLGLLMSPALTPITDARESASREFDLTLGSGPGAQAVNAVLASAQGGRLSPTTTISRPQLMTSMDWTPVGQGRALELLMASVDAKRGYSGVQRVTLSNAAGGHVVAEVAVAQQPGSGIGVTVRDSGGTEINAGVLPGKQSDMVASLPPSATSYRLGPGGVIAGQQAVLLEAKRADRSLVARWWLSPDLGLVLWNETFDSTGRLVRSAGFSELQLTSIPPQVNGLPLQLSSAPAAVPDATRAMCTGGFNCASQLGGFTLVQISSDSPMHPSVVHAVYRKGDLCITVLQQRGRLVASSTPEYGISPDRTVTTWQSGTVVYTVTTNAAPSVAQPLVDELPHERPTGADPVSRSWAGLMRLIGRGPR